MLSKLFNAVGAAFQALALLSAAPIAVASGIAAADHAHPISGSTTAGEKRELPSWLLGVWSREWIAKQDVRPNTFDVHYLQAPTFFADVRFPTDQPRLVRAGSFADLTDAELLLLARQRGFTGRTTVTGTTATWHHEIDFQPPDGTEDVGRLEPIAGIGMVEHALDESYVESWRRVSVDEGRFLVIRIERAGRLDRVLLVISDDFLYVRNRARDLPVSESLEALIKSTRASRAQIIEYLDCEFSTGKVRSGAVPWEIQRSTLPWREGHHLEWVDRITVSDGVAALDLHAQAADHWNVAVNTFPAKELFGLFGAAPRRASGWW